MRLLVLTQAVDRNDTVLGFMHEWLEAFSKQFEHITVIALRVGDHRLPKNVTVMSLGKDEGKSRWTYVARFFRYIIALRNTYDGVFVHMNPEYVVLGGILWRAWRKKIILWYNHTQGGFRLALATHGADEVFYTSPFAASAGSKKGRRMPVGVDTALFKSSGPHVRASERTILSLGRIAPIKHLEVMLGAIASLQRDNRPVRMSIVGDALPEHAAYLGTLRSASRTLRDRVAFLPGVAERGKVAQLFSSNEFFVNASPAGLFDKAVFEAMACECVPVVSSGAFADLLPAECLFEEGDSKSLAEKLGNLMSKPSAELDALGRKLRELVVAEHSLTRLSALIAGRFNAKS